MAESLLQVTRDDFRLCVQVDRQTGFAYHPHHVARRRFDTALKPDGTPRGRISASRWPLVRRDQSRGAIYERARRAIRRRLNTVNLLEPSLQQMLVMAVDGHGVPYSQNGEWLVLGSGSVSLKIERFIQRLEPNFATLVVQVTLRCHLLGLREIVECFAGIGETVEEAEKVAFHKFLSGTFHVFMEALVPHRCDQPQSEIEHWESAGGSWNVFSGPLLSQYSSNSVLSPDYGQMLQRIRSVFARTDSRQPQWIRIFISASGGKILGGEVLMNNETWQSAERELLSFPWKASREYQALRHFLIALPREV